MISGYLTVSYIVGVFSKSFNFDRHLTVIAALKTSPLIDIYLPCCGEDITIIRNTYEWVSKLKYANLNIYVLDDGGSSEVRAAAELYQFTYICRPNRGELKKAGNLRYAFAITRGDYIAIFDADFCPRADFIQETLPYFHHDPNIAIVQTPQYFQIKDGQSWVRKGAAYIQELFYRLIQVNRDYFDGSICVGSNAMYRRKALEPFGGTAAIDYSEDVHTGFNVTRNGQKVRYLPIVLAKGLCPDSLPGYFIQQYRWAMGSISLLSSHAIWKAPLTRMQRVCYLSGMLYYISTGIGIFLTPLPSMLLVWFAPQHVFWYNAFFSLLLLIT